MKRLAVVFSFILLLLPITSYAQDALEVGTPVRGEITNAEFEVEYTFSGAADSVVIIAQSSLNDDGSTNDLESELILLDPNGAIVSDTSDIYTYRNAVLVTQLPADGEYTVIATREDGRAGDSVGSYTLTLTVPDILNVGDVLSVTIASGQIGYSVIVTEEDFNLVYTKTDGSYTPDFLIKTLNDNNEELDDYVSVGGKVKNFTIADIPSGLYIIVLDRPSFSYYRDEVTADFTLSVEPALR